ncbi:hypothetical protein CEXT_674361 [Caerostris extrusa]|uniref:Uncharacterized protein n=1 Tax=Caerostris extrusa TaxID=172846 RepID=A0AAV4MXB5_CAEEX|nr:hypothetical protein CEXT_674361 [Caerostris extrusa]
MFNDGIACNTKMEQLYANSFKKVKLFVILKIFIHKFLGANCDEEEEKNRYVMEHIISLSTSAFKRDTPKRKIKNLVRIYLGVLESALFDKKEVFMFEKRSLNYNQVCRPC